MEDVGSICCGGNREVYVVEEVGCIYYGGGICCGGGRRYMLWRRYMLFRMQGCICFV